MLVTRSEAMAKGQRYYFTGKPCCRGHIANRLVSTFVCVECNALANLEWRKKYPERFKVNNRVRTKAYYHRHLEYSREAKRKWRTNNLAKAVASERKRYACNKDNPEWRASRAKACSNFRKRHPDRHCHKQAMRRATKLRATPKWLTQKQRKEIALFYEEAHRLTNTTFFEWHVDHIEPLRGSNLCGLHVPWNLQLLPAELNMRKGART